MDAKDIAIKVGATAAGAVVAGPVGAGVALAATSAIQAGTKK